MRTVDGLQSTRRMPSSNPSNWRVPIWTLQDRLAFLEIEPCASRPAVWVCALQVRGEACQSMTSSNGRLEGSLTQESALEQQSSHEREDCPSTLRSPQMCRLLAK